MTNLAILAYEYQLFKANVSQSATDYIKSSRRKENLKAMKSKERANFCPKKKVAELLNTRKRVADTRMHARRLVPFKTPSFNVMMN